MKKGKIFKAPLYRLLHVLIAAFSSEQDQTDRNPHRVFRMDLFHPYPGLFYLGGRYHTKETFRQTLCKASYYRCGPHADGWGV
jgi:hypothetical protein